MKQIQSNRTNVCECGHDTKRITLYGCGENDCIFTNCVFPFRTQHRDNGKYV